jgi:4-hydroxyphenylacetate 3-monooxygenase
MAEALNDQAPSTMDMLGEIQGYVEVTRSVLELAIERSYEWEGGGWFPEGRGIHPMRSLLADWFTRVNDIILRIGSHNLLAAPSQGMLSDERIRGLADVYLRGAGDVDVTERAGLFRLAWDFVGSGLGARAALYERYYLGSATMSRQRAHMSSDRTRPYDLVRRMLATVDQPAVGP